MGENHYEVLDSRFTFDILCEDVAQSKFSSASIKDKNREIKLISYNVCRSYMKQAIQKKYRRSILFTSFAILAISDEDSATHLTVLWKYNRRYAVLNDNLDMY